MTIELHSDFQVGTGTGRGRTIDAEVVKDSHGCPYILGSSLKGLARYHAAEFLEPSFAEFDQSLLDSAFGKSGKSRGWFHFTDAVVSAAARPPRPLVVGRSARERQSGTTKEHSLFFNELAAGATFMAEVCAENLPDNVVGLKAILLLVVSLRRIESLGASRRRGLGRCSVQVLVVEGPELLQNQKLPTPTNGEADSSHGASQKNWLENVLPEVQSFQPSSKKEVDIATPDPANPEWACLPLIAQAKCPLVLAANQGADNIINSLDYVPGSTLRGAVAHWLMRNGAPPESDLFQRLIVHEQLQFGPLYPLQASWNKSQTMPTPMPQSFVQCKFEPGELRSAEPNYKGHGLVDRLAYADRQECGCGEALTPCRAWMNIVQPNDQVEQYELRTWNCRRQAIQRTAIDSETTHRARPNQLFATEAIAAGTWFAGYIWGPQWAIDLLAQHVFNRMQTFRVGKSQTRGHGHLCVWSERLPAEQTDYCQMRDGVYPLLYAKNSLHESTPDNGFTLTCYSDLIAVDDLLRPITCLTEKSLWSLLRQHLDEPSSDPPPFEIEAAFVSTVRASGFNGQAGLPRMADTAIAAGSTWRLVWNSSNQPLRDDAWKLLLRAHRHGLGLRRGEGFGRMMLNAPIHNATLDQVTHAEGPEENLWEYASFSAQTHAASFRNADARSQVRNVELATPWLAPDRKKAKDIAKRCHVRVRGAAARLLWQFAQCADPSQRLQQAIDALLDDSGSAFPLLAGKQDSTRRQLAEFFKNVAKEFKYDAKSLGKLAPRLQLLAEYLQLIADDAD